jgi:hypothetical protein
VCAQIRATNAAYQTWAGGAWFDTEEAARASFEAYQDLSPDYNYTIGALTRNSNTTNFGATTHTATTGYCSRANPTSCGSLSATTFQSRQAADAAVSCPPPEPECGDGTKGRLQPTRANSASQVTTIIGSCLDGCAVSGVKLDPVGINKDVDGTFYFLPFVKFSGEECSGGAPELPPDDPEPVAEPQGEVCKTTAGGLEVCTSSQYGENCGYLNDKLVCLGKTDPDECWVNADGSRYCGEQAPTPPVPDNGSPGVKATPNDQVAANGPGGGGNTYNYFNTATVAGSSRPAGTDGANPNRPSSTNPATPATPTVDVGGGGDGTGEEPGGGSASGGETCAAPPVCEGDALECAQLIQQWRIGCPASQTEAEMRAGITDTGIGADGKFPAGSSVTLGSEDFDSAGFLSGGACPVPTSFDLGSFGSVGFDAGAACSLLSILASMFLVSGWLTAARIAFGS